MAKDGPPAYETKKMSQAELAQYVRRSMEGSYRRELVDALFSNEPMTLEHVAEAYATTRAEVVGFFEELAGAGLAEKVGSAYRARSAPSAEAVLDAAKAAGIDVDRALARR